MSLTVSLPYLDPTGELTPLVIDAMKSGGVTSAHDPDDAGKIILTFDSAGFHEMFCEVIADALKAHEAWEVEFQRQCDEHHAKMIAGEI